MPAVLFVCTGNLCRSPLMQFLASAAVADAHITWISAGTFARGRDEMHPFALRVLASRGIDGSAFGTTPLASSIEHADYVIAAAREHRAAAVTLRPALLNRSFTLAELSRVTASIDPGELPAGTPSERLAALVPLAAARRGLSLPAKPDADDLSDPLGQPVEMFEACAQQIEQLLDPIARVLRNPV